MRRMSWEAAQLPAFLDFGTSWRSSGRLELVVAGKRLKPKPPLILKAATRLGDKANLIRRLAEQGHRFKLGEAIVTDFTEIIYDHGKKTAQLAPMIGYVEKVCWGWSLADTAMAVAVLAAWDKAKKTRRRWGLKTAGVIVHHDLGATYTSWAWLRRLLSRDKVLVSWALRSARDNPEMESFNSHFKQENRSLFWECESFEELLAVVADRIHYYNYHRRHAALKNQRPIEYLKNQGKPVKKNKN